MNFESIENESIEWHLLRWIGILIFQGVSKKTIQNLITILEM